MKYLIILIVVLMTANLFADELTLEKAKEIALQNNPDLLAKEQAKKSAQWQSKGAYMVLAPAINLNGGYTIYDPVIEQGGAPGVPIEEMENSKSYGISVSQPIYNGGKVYYAAKLVKDSEKLADYGYEGQILSTIANVESKYFSVLEQKKMLETSRKDLEASQKHLEIAKVRFDTGTLSKGDYLNMQSKTASKEVSLIQMQNLYEITKLDLANFLQIQPNFTFADVNPESYQLNLEKIQGLNSGQIENIENQISKAGTENNPTLKMTKTSTQISEKSYKIARGNFLPSLNLSYNKNWSKSNLDDDFDASGTLMLNASIPIFPIYDNYSDLQKAKYDLKEAQFTEQAAEDGINLMIRQSLYNLIASAKTVSSAKIALEFAHETYNQMEIRFKNNLISSADMLDAEVLLTSSENQYTSSFYNFLRAKSSLMQQMGIKDESQFWSFID